VQGTTGEIHHVDSGYHTVGMKNPEAPDIAIVAAEATVVKKTGD
jgi:enoyl-[acyl-carrier protein] reductase I